MAKANTDSEMFEVIQFEGAVNINDAEEILNGINQLVRTIAPVSVLFLTIAGVISHEKIRLGLIRVPLALDRKSF